MNVNEAKELKRGMIIRISQFGKIELARVIGWDWRAGGIDYSALTGGGSIAKPDHIIEIVAENSEDCKEWNETYEKHWGAYIKEFVK